MFTTSETYPWSFVTQIFHNGQPTTPVTQFNVKVSMLLT